ncbi:ATP-binding protein [Cellulomonas shaoxiangyii]|uniref:ATP-binding protein n=1 Tax=Cellulomonas shaoxiangyii TaxID=2566013 RepID=A0A4P7SNU8_9CELL|nr:ATP-binding protein [Cellulomonas shaoxiangyii]QCB94946.1 ATP-binding protein [Cellulomonas shaoxiangyii]TGY84454.1 ATP-binding protein [Cellulomonas shaoxiangyii]
MGVNDEPTAAPPRATPAGTAAAPVGAAAHGGVVPPATLPADHLSGRPTPTGEELHASHPAPTFVALRRWVLSNAVQLRTLRGDLRKQIAASSSSAVGPLGDVPEKVVLVASELATNALAHGRPPTQVRLAQDGTTFLLEVSDGAVDRHPFLAEGRAPGDGGFGLQIARRLSLDVGWYADSEGKHVWATFCATDDA